MNDLAISNCILHIHCKSGFVFLKGTVLSRTFHSSNLGTIMNRLILALFLVGLSLSFSRTCFTRSIEARAYAFPKRAGNHDKKVKIFFKVNTKGKSI